MEEKKRVLLVTQELEPYLSVSDVSGVASKLPKLLADEGMEIRILMPRFGSINERRHRLHEVVRLSGINIIIDEDDYPLVIKVASLPGLRLQVYFLDNEDFFKRKNAFADEENNFYEDNAERMIFFCKGVLETVKKFGWPPDIIHCHGWMTSLVPLYLKTLYKNDPVFTHSKVIYSVYDNMFRGKLKQSLLEKEPIDSDGLNGQLDHFQKGDNAGLNLGAAAFADAFIFGSEKADKKAVKTKKPHLRFKKGDDALSAYTEFYQSLLELEV